MLENILTGLNPNILGITQIINFKTFNSNKTQLALEKIGIYPDFFFETRIQIFSFLLKSIIIFQTFS